MSADRSLIRLSSFFGRYLQLVARSSNFTILTSNGDALHSLESAAVNARLTKLAEESATLFPFWNAHALVLLTFFAASETLQGTRGQFYAVADDSLGGRITQQLFGNLNIPHRRLSYVSQVQRLEDIKRILNERSHLVIAADSHGPYRSVSPGMARLAYSYGSVRGLSAWCSHSIPLFRNVRMRLPLPTANIIVALGPRIIFRGAANIAEGRAQLQALLSSLEERAILISRRSLN